MMESRKKRKSLSSNYPGAKKQFQNFDECLMNEPDIDEKCLNSVFEATRNVKEKTSICAFSVKTNELGLAAVDVREFSDICYAASFSSQVHVLSCSADTLCEELDHKPKKKRVNLQSSVGFKEVKVLPHLTDVTALSYMNGSLLLSATLDGTVKAWNRNYELMDSFEDTMKSLSDIHANAKRDSFVTSSLSGVRSGGGEVLHGASLFSFSRSHPILSLVGHTAPTQAARFHPNGLYVATASRDGTAKLWSTRAPGPPLRTFGAGGPALAFSPDGALLATAGRGSVSVWDIASGRPLRTLECGRTPRHLCYAPCGTLLAAHQGHLLVWDAQHSDPCERPFLGRAVLRVQCSDGVFCCVCPENGS